MTNTSLVTRIGEADLKLLRVFKAVVESGGLSSAEVELNIGRSTISKYLADLEFRLDMRLCNRGPAGFSLTQDGDQVLAAADRLLASVSSFRIEINEIKQQLAGTVRLALFDQCASNPEAHLGRTIHEFNKLAADAEIELSIEPPNIIEAKVLQGELDIGIIAYHRPSAGLEYRHLYGENMYLYCGADHPLFDREPAGLTLEDVRQCSYAGISVNSPNLHFGQRLKLSRSAKVQSEHALTILILSGSYIGFLPDHLAHDHVKAGLMKAVLPDAIHYRPTFSAVTRRGVHLPRIVKLFLETLVAQHAGVSAAP